MAVRLFQAGEWGEKWGRGGGNGVYTRSIRLLTVITVEQSRESFPWEMATLFVILSKVKVSPYSYLLLRDIFREDRALIVLEYCN